MRVLVLHESPGLDGVAEEFAEAARDFNRGLDIRLRFLEVGFELRLFAVAGADEGASPEMEGLLRRFAPSVVLVLGGGPRLLECVACAAKSRARIAFLPNGEADRTALAIARMSQVLVTRPGSSFPPHPAGGSRHRLGEHDSPGAGLVRVLVKAGRGS